MSNVQGYLAVKLEPGDTVSLAGLMSANPIGAFSGGLFSCSHHILIEALQSTELFGRQKFIGNRPVQVEYSSNIPNIVKYSLSRDHVYLMNIRYIYLMNI